MKVREILGLDFCGDRLNVVQLRHETPRPLLTRWAGRTVPAGGEGAAVAAALRKMLDEEGFTASSAALGLPRGRGFLRCRGPGEAGPEAPREIDYITDGWTTIGGRQVLGVASRADVTRLVEIAHQASLQPLAVELRSMGTLTALGLLAESAADRTSLGLIIGETEVTLALVDDRAPLIVQTRGRSPGADPLDRWENALATAEQMARLLEMAHPGVAAQTVHAVVNEADRQAARSLSGRLGLPVQLVRPGAQVNLGVEGGDLAEPAEYAAAIGLALEALQESANGAARPRRVHAVGRMNFLESGRERPRKVTLSWRHAVAAAAAVVLVGLGVSAAAVLAKRGELRELEARYGQLADDSRQHRQDQQRWRAVSPWLARSHDGRRVSQRRIYDAITELFPSKDAYIQKMIIQPGEDGDGLTIILSGRARAEGVLSEFVSRLNASPRFARASLGPVIEEPGTSEFPKSYSVTFSLGRQW